MTKSHIGFKLLTIREDEEVALSLGINTFKLKLFVVTMSSIVCGILGGLYAQYISYVDASSEPGGVLSMSTGFDAILIVLVGGMNTIWGPLIGAIIRIGLGELLRVTFGWSAGIDLAIFGALLTLCILFLRQGIYGFIKERMTRTRRLRL
jgi:branched-chain amino acid transport system permease protein